MAVSFIKEPWLHPMEVELLQSSPNSIKLFVKQKRNIQLYVSDNNFHMSNSSLSPSAGVVGCPKIRGCPHIIYTWHISWGRMRENVRKLCAKSFSWLWFKVKDSCAIFRTQPDSVGLSFPKFCPNISRNVENSRNYSSCATFQNSLLKLISV